MCLEHNFHGSSVYSQVNLTEPVKPVKSKTRDKLIRLEKNMVKEVTVRN